MDTEKVETVHIIVELTQYYYIVLQTASLCAIIELQKGVIYMAQSTISARIDSNDKVAFDLFCSRVGLNTSSVLNLFIKKVISENKIPFEISAPKFVSLEEGKKAFYQLREEARINEIQDMTLDEINSEISAYRSGE